MTLVRVLKSLGFEQVGDIVDYRGNLEEALAKGEVEVLGTDPRPVVNSTTVDEVPAVTVTAPAATETPTKPETLLEKIETEIKEVVSEVEGK